MRTVSEMLKISMWKYFTVAFYVLKVAHLSGRADYRNPDDQYRSYRGHQLLRIYPSQPEDLEKLKLLEQDESRKIDFWQRPSSSKRNVDILVAPEDREAVKELMKTHGLDVAVVSEDIQSLIDEELKQRSEHTWKKRSPPSKRLHKYLSFDSIMEWMEETKEKCQFCDIISIGKSSEGRDLKVLKITKATGRKPAIFIDAGFHAREWIGPITALNFIDALINESDPVMNFLMQEYVWYVLPLANPDGYVYSWTKDRLWRKTRSRHDANGCVGADLNRNWDYFWGGEGTSRNSCRENFCGPRPFSEPEARALADFLLEKSNDLIIYISLHSYGQLLLAPWGYTTQVPHDFYDLLIRGTEAAEAMRKSTGTKYAVGSTGRMLYLASGASDDWVKGVAKVKYSFTIELRDLGTRGFLLPENEIPDTALEATNGITKMSLDVLKELKRFGNKYSVVFQEDNFQDIFRKPEEKSESNQEQQSQRNRKVLENALADDYGKNPKNEELARDDVEDQYKDDLRYEDIKEEMEEEEEEKGAEAPTERQDLFETRSYDDKELKKSLEETMNLQKLRLRQIMKSFEDEIQRQNIWYKRKPNEDSKDNKVKLKSKLQYLKKFLY